MTPQCPWSVYSQKQTSAIRTSSGTAALTARSARCTMPSSDHEALPAASLVFRQPEEQHRRNALPRYLAADFDDPVDRVLVHAGHRAHRAGDAVAGTDEKGIDEIRGREPRLANHPAQELGVRRKPAKSGLGEGHSR